MVDGVVELVSLRNRRLGEDVHRLRDGVRIHRADRVGARPPRRHRTGSPGRGLEPAGLVGAEPVLAGEHHGERPAGGRRAAQRCLGHRERDVPRDLRSRDGDRADRVAAGVDEPLAEALHLDQPAPGAGRLDRVVALRERRGRRGRRRRRVADVDVDQLGAERAAEGRCQVARLHPEGHCRARCRRPGSRCRS